MSWDFFNTTLQVAQKNYTCDGCDWINENLCDFIDELTFTEKRELVRARKNKYKIIKGQTYVKTTGMWEGEFSVYRSIPEIDKICEQHGVFDTY